MKRWFGPSLLRRMVLTMLAALLLVWVALSFKDYWTFKQDVSKRESLGRVTRAILDSLQGLDAQQAHTALLAADRVYNDLRRQAEPQAPGALLFRLSRLQDGQLVYGSGDAAPLPDLPAQDTPAQVVHQGMGHWPVVRQNTQWRLAVWVPVMEDGTALARIGLDVLGYVLLALPLVLVPMFLAMWLGLRPLHRFGRQIAHRPPDDLSPLREPTGYAELAPLVDAFNALLDRARQQRETEKAFVQDAAHELKTPLAVVAAQAHALATAQDAAQRAAAQQALERGVQRASHQVNQLLTLAALEHAGAGPLRETDLVALAREVLIELEPLARGRGTELVLRSADALTHRIEGEVLRSVLVNLVRNAIQHGAAGGVVTVGLEQQGGGICLAVSDDGPGIPPAERERVFDRFYRAETAGSPGSGLGLAIVQRAARRLGARVRIEDGPDGRGVTVLLHF